MSVSFTSWLKKLQAKSSGKRNQPRSTVRKRHSKGLRVEQLEDRLARFLGKEAALVFSTGYQTNLGVVATLVHKGDYLFLDKLNHASLVDSARLAYGTVCRYLHNDMRALEQQLSQAPNHAGKLIVTDGVFSMDGDIVNLPEMVALAETYNADILVDDAHAIGVLGELGGGTAQHFGLEDQVSLIVATFSKSLASIGGVVAGAEPVIHYLKHGGRRALITAPESLRQAIEGRAGTHVVGRI